MNELLMFLFMILIQCFIYWWGYEMGRNLTSSEKYQIRSKAWDEGFDEAMKGRGVFKNDKQNNQTL